MAARPQGERVARWLPSALQRSQAPEPMNLYRKEAFSAPAAEHGLGKSLVLWYGAGARGRGHRRCHPAHLAPSGCSQLSPPLNLWSARKVELEKVEQVEAQRGARVAEVVRGPWAVGERSGQAGVSFLVLPVGSVFQLPRLV